MLVSDSNHISFSISCIWAIIPAAGMSSRMGEFKPLLAWPVDGTAGTVLSSVLSVCQKAGIFKIALVIGHRGDEILGSLTEHPAVIIRISDPKLPMGESIAAAVASIPEPCSYLIFPADHPAVSPATLIHLAEERQAHPDAIIIPVFENRRGHPVLFPACARSKLLSPDPEQGPRAIIRGGDFEVIEARVNDPGIRVNLDYPSDYKRACSNNS